MQITGGTFSFVILSEVEGPAYARSAFERLRRWEEQVLRFAQDDELALSEMDSLYKM